MQRIPSRCPTLVQPLLQKEKESKFCVKNAQIDGQRWAFFYIFANDVEIGIAILLFDTIF